MCVYTIRFTSEPAIHAHNIPNIVCGKVYKIPIFCNEYCECVNAKNVHCWINKIIEKEIYTFWFVVNEVNQKQPSKHFLSSASKQQEKKTTNSLLEMNQYD